MHKGKSTWVDVSVRMFERIVDPTGHEEGAAH